MLSTEETLRLTVAALMQHTGERQADVGQGCGLSQIQVSRRQAAVARWTLDDCDALAAHWGMPVLDLLAGPTHAVTKLPPNRIVAGRRGAQTLIPVSQDQEMPPAGAPARPPRRATPPPAAPPEEESAPPAARRTVVPHRPAPAGPLTDQIHTAVARQIAEHDGDVDAAKAALIKSAVPDVMALFHASRVGGRYEHTDHPPTQDILKKTSQKGADQIWEGRPKWRATELHRAARTGLITLDVTALDINGAYLAALKTWLPIGKLVHSTDGVHDRKRSGVHLVTPPEWTASDLPSPLGARQEPGRLWITEPTLRLLLRCAQQGLCEAPVIHESWTSGASEGLLEKMRRALTEVRQEAIANNDEVTLEYVKSMYSKFVSTIGESAANREIRRPDWMHIIRSQAFANLWMKAEKAHTSGLTVVEMSGTDELHIAGDWQSVFTEGRDLSQVKPKHTYTLGAS
ncbi:acyltransferase [Streptomyces sp. NPDC017979]|uniref:acyltransferase n=1 Tax=Streptomyces sp. NPDC017979 TaxID=3365024 RepID=UPI0037949108